jgi:two-component system, LytTR family, sensor kinase
MGKANKYIGFNDKLIGAIMVPLSALIIPMIFFGRRFGRPPFYTWQVYVTTLVTTTVIWIGNRYIMIWSRQRYPQFIQTRKRLWVQSVIMFFFTIIAVNTCHFLMRDFCGLLTPTDKDILLVDLLFNGNAAALFCSLTAIAIYEGIYFMKQLRYSVEEKENLKRESLKAQLNALKAQVNPHFLFNNLNTLCSLIPENPKHAVDFVQQLSKVYRHILEVKDEKSISLKDELDVLQAYSFLLKTRFGNNLSVNIEIPEEKLHKKIVPLSLQLLMENAIKHNIVSADKPLQINIFSDNGNLVVDNNLQMKKQITESTGIGLDNIRNRYKLLSDKPVKVTESETNFTVSIPLIDN